MTTYQSGMLLALPRDEAKQFFGCREESDRMVLLEELCNSDLPRIDCQGQADVWQEFLRSVDAEMLGVCFTGGRVMQQSAAAEIYLLRPDFVQRAAARMQEIDQSDLSQWPTDESAEAVWPVVEKMTAFFQKAADLGAAVVYVTQ